MKNLRLVSQIILCAAIICASFSSASFADEAAIPASNELPVISDAGGAQVDINQATNSMTITAQNAISVLSFSSFNIGSNASFNIVMPSTDSRMLNKVSGNSTSNIFGGITCNQGLWVLVNTNGIYFAPSARVNVDNMIASTLDISTNNFLNGNYIFEHQGSNYAQLLNEGTIEGNNIALMGSAVANTGIVLARAGSVHLASGDKTTVSFDRRGLIAIEINENTSGEVVDRNGTKVEDAVANSGSIQGVTVAMTANTARNIFKNAVNQTGIVRATSIVEEEGVIRIVANNKVSVSGTLETVAQDPTENKSAIIIQSQDFINVSSEFITVGNTTLESAGGIAIDANITTYSGNLQLLADNDLDGVGVFTQSQGTTISTLGYGDITIQASGASTLANINSAGDLILKQGGAPVTFTQLLNSTITTQGSLTINPGVTLNASNTSYNIGKDWVNLGNFNPQLSHVALVSSQDALVKGDNIFYDFSINEPGKIVKFDSEKTQAILGTLTFRGEYGNLLTLTSIDPTKQWSINPLGQTDIQYSLISNLNNIRGPPLKALHTSSLGNNTNLDLDPFWTGNGPTSNWSDPDNWDTGTTPTAFDTVTFDGITGTNPNKNSFIDPVFAGSIDNLTLNGYTGTLTLQRDLTISGNLNIQTGTFDTSTYTVTFIDSSKPSNISGNITFYNFICTTPDKELYFQAGKTYTFTNSLTIVGAPDQGPEEYYIKLRSQTPGSQYYLNVQTDTYTLERINISDAYSQNLVNIPIGIDSGNNINFDIDPVWDNGSGNGLWSTATNWDGNAVPTGSQTVTFNNTSTANCSIDNAGTWSGGTFTIAGTYTGTITVNVSTLTIGAFSQAGGTFNGGSATLNMASFSLTGGTFTSTSGTLNITGNFSRTAGTFTHNSGTVVFTTSDNSITSGGQSFYNLTVNGANDSEGYYYTLTLNDALSVANDLTLSQVSAGSSTITVGRHFSVDGANGETGYNSASIVLTGTGNLTYSNLTAPWSNGFYNLTCGQNGNTTTLQSTIGVINQLTIGSGTLTGNYTVCMIGNGNVFSFNSASTFSTSQINFYSTSGTVNLPALTNGYSTSINVSNNNTVISQTGDVTLNGLNITTDGFTGRTATWNTNGYALTVTGSITVGVSGDTATKTLNITNSTLTVGGNFTIASTQAVFTTTGSTVIFNGSGTQQLTSAGESFNNLTHSGSGTLQLQDALDVNGTFLNSAGTFNANNKNMNFAGDWSNTGSATFTRGSGTLTFDGTTTLTNSSSNAADLGALTITGTVTLGSNATITSCSGAGTLNLGTGSYTLTISDTGSPLGVTTFNKGTGSTVKYSGISATNIATVAYNNLQLSGATTYSLTGNLTSGNALTGNLTIDSGATLDTTSANNYNIALAGNWDNNGTFTYNSGTVNFNGTTQFITDTTFNNLTFAGSGLKTISGVIVNGTLSMEGTATVSAALTYGGSATLQYKGSSTQTTGAELPATIFNLTVNNANGVILSISPTVTGTLTLTSGKFLVSVTADSGQSKIYGAADPIFTYTITSGNFVSGGAGALSRTAGENIGTYAITQGSLAGTHYTVTFTSADFAIDKKTLTIGGSFTVNNKTYDGTTSATINNNGLTLVGIAGVDDVTLTPVVVFSDKGIGYARTVSLTAGSSLSGAASGNYSLSLVGAPTATANIVDLPASDYANLSMPQFTQPITTMSSMFGFGGMMPMTFGAAVPMPIVMLAPVLMSAPPITAPIAIPQGVSVPQPVLFEGAASDSSLPVITTAETFIGAGAQTVLLQPTSFEGTTSESELPAIIVPEGFSGVGAQSNLPQVATEETFLGNTAQATLPEPLFKDVGTSGNLPQPIVQPTFEGITPNMALPIAEPLIIREINEGTKVELMFPGGKNLIPTYGTGIPFGVEGPVMDTKIRLEAENEKQ